MKSKWVMALVVVLVGAGAYGGAVLATPSNGLSTSTLAKATASDLNLTGHAVVTTVGKDGKTRPTGIWLSWLKTFGLSDLYVIDNKILPGGTTGWHSHPGPSLIFVVAGAVTNYVGDEPGCPPHVYAAGSSFVDAGGTEVHTLRNEGTVDAETIAMQFLPQGAARRIDEPVPAGCPA